MYKYWIIFTGQYFFPRSLSIINHHYVDKIFEPGEYRKGKLEKSKLNNPYNYGYLRIKGESLVELLLFAMKIKEQCVDSVDEVVVEVLYYYENQCNLEFSIDELKMIAEMGAVLTVSCDTLNIESGE